MVEQQTPHILVVGNLSDGFTFVGPFSSFEAANEHADVRFSAHNTWISQITSTAPVRLRALEVLLEDFMATFSKDEETDLATEKTLEFVRVMIAEYNKP
jgi:hypothetical protein